jgi:hypothetical protein
MLAEALSAAACMGLERLLLPGAALGPVGVAEVCAAVPPNLTLLDLGSNNCGDKGAKAAGEALRRCPGLRRLGLASNDIGAEGARLLAPSIRDHAALEELHLQGNRAGLGGLCGYACHVIGTHVGPSFHELNGILCHGQEHFARHVIGSTLVS